MRICGKILKRELRKEDKRKREMTGEYIAHLLEEQAHSAESKESSIDSASVNFSQKEDVVEEKEEEIVTSAEPQKADEQPTLSTFLAVLFCFYMIAIVIAGN